jgi:phosphoenolpyruvate-protein kinase (PTS system EI component)
MDLSSIKKKKASIPQREIERFRGAVEYGIEQINVVKNRMGTLISKEEGAIFDVYRLILEDPAIIQQIEAQIRKQGYAAEYAIRVVFERYLPNYFTNRRRLSAERTTDVKDAAQLSGKSRGLRADKSQYPKTRCWSRRISRRRT